MPAKPLREYRTLLVIDKPDGTRMSLFADTPGQVTNGRLLVLGAENGWDGSADSPLHPCPGHRLYVKHTASFKTRGDSYVPTDEAPWVLHCICVTTP
jgi:hypothetical protein